MCVSFYDICMCVCRVCVAQGKKGRKRGSHCHLYDIYICVCGPRQGHRNQDESLAVILWDRPPTKHRITSPISPLHTKTKNTTTKNTNTGPARRTGGGAGRGPGGGGGGEGEVRARVCAQQQPPDLLPGAARCVVFFFFFSLYFVFVKKKIGTFLSSPSLTLAYFNQNIGTFLSSSPSPISSLLL